MANMTLLNLSWCTLAPVPTDGFQRVKTRWVWSMPRTSCRGDRVRLGWDEGRYLLKAMAFGVSLGGRKRCVETSQAGGAVWGKTQGWESPGRMGDPSQPEAGHMEKNG